MKTVKKILIFMIAALVMFPGFAFADEQEIIFKDYHFSSESKDNISYDAPETITENGREYVLSDISYDIVSYKEPEEISYEIKVKSLDEIKDYETRTEERNGKEVLFRAVDFDNVKWEKTEDYKPIIVLYEEVTYKTKEEIPQSFVKDGHTYVRETIREEATLETFTTPAYFASTDKNNTVYSFNGKFVEISGSEPIWDGWEDDVLAYLKVDPKSFIIDSISWNGDFTGEEGNYQREATVTGRREVVSYVGRFCYNGIYDWEDDPREDIYLGKVLYVEEGGASYEIVAHATYTLVPMAIIEEGGLTLKKALAIGGGVAVLAGCGAGLFFFLSKKKKEKDK